MVLRVGKMNFVPFMIVGFVLFGVGPLAGLMSIIDDNLTKDEKYDSVVYGGVITGIGAALLIGCILTPLFTFDSNPNQSKEKSASELREK